MEYILPRIGPSGAQNCDIETLEAVIEKEIADEKIAKKKKEERIEKKRWSKDKKKVSLLLIRQEEEKKLREKALLAGKDLADSEDGSLLMKEKNQKPCWKRYVKRILRRIKIDKVRG